MDPALLCLSDQFRNSSTHKWPMDSLNEEPMSNLSISNERQFQQLFLLICQSCWSSKFPTLCTNTTIWPSFLDTYASSQVKIFQMVWSKLVQLPEFESANDETICGIASTIPFFDAEYSFFFYSLQSHRTIKQVKSRLKEFGNLDKTFHQRFPSSSKKTKGT